MCRCTAKNNVSRRGLLAKGLNIFILFLICFFFLFCLSFIFSFFFVFYWLLFSKIANYFFQKNLRNNIEVVYNTSLPVIFGVKKYADALWKVCENRDVHVNLTTNLIEVRADKCEAVFQSLTKPDETRVEKVRSNRKKFFAEIQSIIFS